MSEIQPGIANPVPSLGCHLFFSLKIPNSSISAIESSLTSLKEIANGTDIVIGIGNSLIHALKKNITNMRQFPSNTTAGIEIPATPHALWCWIRQEDRGAILHTTRNIQHQLVNNFQLQQSIETFKYGAGLDLTGYEDGTENPQGNDIVKVAQVNNSTPGLQGSSFAVIQQWEHNLDYFQSLPQQEQDDTIGRRKSDNEELDDAPESAHVKRTAQESFTPEAFMVRRSMPWSEQEKSGLVFLAFADSFDPFQAQLSRMVGEEDGIQDAIFKFTRPITGSYFWCPPLKNGQLDLSALGI